MIKHFVNLIILFLILVTYSCKDPITGQIENLPPDTHLSLFPDSTIAPGTTLKTIRWWGDDPDGYVAYFRISFDSINWGNTTRNDSTFILHINGNDSTFRFFVAAVDDKGLIDPTPATNLYPVINSPPNVTFDAGTEIPDTTYPVATFKWTGTDPDGNENIRYYQWSLNDTNHFRRLPGNINLLTLTKDSGLAINSNNILYLKAEDDAGALSKIVRMPDTTRTWFVKNNLARIMLIKDMPLSDMFLAAAYFQNAFDTIRYDVLDIKSNNGNLIPKIVNPMFIETLKLFDIVVWSAYRGGSTITNDANFSLAQQSLPFYLQSGRKVFFTTGFPNVYQAQGGLINFAPVDSIKSCLIRFINESDTLTKIDNSYPSISPSATIGSIRGIFVSPPAQVIYKIKALPDCTDSSNVMIKDVAVNPKIIFMSMPIYYLDGNPNLSKDLFRKILIQEFGYN